MRKWAAGILTILLIECSGCGCNTLTSGQEALTDISGTWTWKIGSPGCPVLDGFLDGADGDEVFQVTQNGNRLAASFVDGDGNTVVLDATYSGGAVSGTFTITEPALLSAPLETGFDCGGRAYQHAPSNGNLLVFDLAERDGAGDITLTPPSLFVRGSPFVSDDGRFYFFPTTGATLVVDTATDTQVATLPFERAAATVGDYYYTSKDATFEDPTVGVAYYDLTQAGFPEAGFIPVDLTLPTLFIPDPANNRLYGLDVVTGFELVLYTIDTAANRVIGTGSLFSNLRAVLDVKLCNGKLWMVGWGNAAAGVIDLTDLSFPTVTHLPSVKGDSLLTTAWSVACDHDRNRVYITDREGDDETDRTTDDGRLIVFDAVTLEEIDRVEWPPGHGFPRVTLCGDGTHGLYGYASGPRIVDLLDLTFPGPLVTTGQNFASGSSLTLVQARQVTPPPPPPPRPPQPRTIVITFQGIARFDDIDRIVNGSFSITSDDSEFADQCVGQGLPFEASVGPAR